MNHPLQYVTVNSILKASSTQTSSAFKCSCHRRKNGSTLHYLLQWQKKDSLYIYIYFYHLLSRRCQTLKHSVGNMPWTHTSNVISMRKTNESRQATQHQQKTRMKATLIQPLIAILYSNLAMTPPIWNQTGAVSFRKSTARPAPPELFRIRKELCNLLLAGDCPQ